MAIFDTVTLY